MFTPYGDGEPTESRHPSSEASTRTGQCYQGEPTSRANVLERESRDARRTERAAASQSKPRTPRERAGPKALVPGGVSEVTERAALLTEPLTAPNLPGLNQRYPAQAAKSLNHSRFPEVAVVQTLCITLEITP